MLLLLRRRRNAREEKRPAQDLIAIGGDFQEENALLTGVTLDAASNIDSNPSIWAEEAEIEDDQFDKYVCNRGVNDRYTPTIYSFFCYYCLEVKKAVCRYFLIQVILPNLMMMTKKKTKVNRRL
jgi:hypothetical protein